MNGDGKQGSSSRGQKNFKRRWGDPWDLPIKGNKIWLREVTEALNCVKRSRDIETSGGGRGAIQTMTKGEQGTQHRGISVCDIQNSIIKLGSKTYMQMDVVVVDQWVWNLIFMHDYYTLGITWF